MAHMLFFRTRVRRTIDILREKHPGRWTYHAKARRWTCSDGWGAYRCAALAPRYDGDDDTFSVQCWLTDAEGRPVERIY